MRTCRATVDRSRSISAGELPRLGLITPRRQQSSTIEWRGEGLWPLGSRGTLTVYARNTRRATARLTYQAGGAPRTLEGEITLHSTAQPLGGRRWWFDCPACGRRCGKLHLPPAGLRFLCRVCHGLAYQCQRESIPARWERRAEKIMERLGGEAEDGLVYKPRWMRWATFHRLMDECEEWDDAATGYRLCGGMKAHGWLSRMVHGRVR